MEVLQIGLGWRDRVRIPTTLLREIGDTPPWLDDLLDTLSAKASWVVDHSVRVAAINAALALSLGLERQDAIHAGLAHDVGKIETPISILEVPILDDEQRGILDEHPSRGQELIGAHDTLIAAIVSTHHAFQPRPYPHGVLIGRRDGSLYKFQMAVALADQVDASTSDRPGSIAKCP
ncbi:MAG: HD domain-containing protein, partial [Candidatus Aenigmarchaeota archaeon]|nr:HD domain-containing protein [Candidatus Aenigmarchaeota archaeon]